MKNLRKLIAAIAIVCGLVACEKGTDNPSAKCQFVLATDMSPLGETLVCTSSYDHFFVAMYDMTHLPVDGQRDYITIEMLGDTAENFVWAGLKAASYGLEGWCFAFKAKVKPAPSGLTGKARIVYDDGTLQFEKTVVLVTPVITDLSNGCESVDLGLSVKWASHNVDAIKEAGYGLFVAWGETSEKSSYDWAAPGDYMWGVYDSKDKPGYGMTKYTADIEGGDGLKKLKPQDDAATANWGTKWRTPTIDEIEELLDNSKCEWTWDETRKGYDVKGLKTGKSIFLPAAGYRVGSEGRQTDAYCIYWSSSVYESSLYYANILSTRPDFHGTGILNRCFGASVRAVTEY